MYPNVLCPDARCILYCQECGHSTVFVFTHGAWLCRNQYFDTMGNVMFCNDQHPTAGPPAPHPAPATAQNAAAATPNGEPPQRPGTPPGILSDLNRKAVTSDFAVVAGDGTRIECHKVILGMRSPVFAAMMSWKEGVAGQVTLDEPAEVIEV